jgi:hypothetical protein
MTDGFKRVSEKSKFDSSSAKEAYEAILKGKGITRNPDCLPSEVKGAGTTGLTLELVSYVTFKDNEEHIGVLVNDIRICDLNGKYVYHVTECLAILQLDYEQFGKTFQVSAEEGEVRITVSGLNEIQKMESFK